jgi:hypothetical protein
VSMTSRTHAPHSDLTAIMRKITGSSQTSYLNRLESWSRNSKEEIDRASQRWLAQEKYP